MSEKRGTANGHPFRPSGVPGLVIFGETRFRNFSLAVKSGDRYLPVAPSMVNEWPTVRDAKTAADRLADVAPWTDPNIKDIVQADRDGYIRRIVSALNGRR